MASKSLKKWESGLDKRDKEGGSKMKKKRKNRSQGLIAILAVAVVFAVMIPAASAMVESSSAIFGETGDNTTVAAADSSDILNISFVDDTNETVWVNITLPLPFNTSLVFNNLIDISYVNPSGETDTAATTVSSGEWGVNVTFDNIAAANDLTTVYLNVTARMEGNYSINVTTSSTKFSIPITIERGKVLNENTSVYYSTIQGAVDAACAGDTVFVRNGIYNEHVTINKELSLVGEDKNNTTIDGDGSGRCIYIPTDFRNPHDVTISGFTVQNGEYGIYIDTIASSKITVEDNIIKSNECGIDIERSHSPFIILKNTYVHSNTKEGIRLFKSCNTIISKNTVDSNYKGIHLDSSCKWCDIHDNTVSNNEDCGLELFYYTAYNDIAGNTVKLNRLGIKLSQMCGDNKIYHNNFVDNTVQTIDTGYDIWDDGYPSGGNYWGDHDCHGNPSDGSEPYIINEGEDSIDYYPFENETGWMGVPPVASFTYAPEKPVVDETITFDASSSYDLDGGTIEKYEWDFDDENFSEGKIVTHSYLYAGNYTVSLTVTDDEGATDVAEQIVNVTKPQPKEANVSIFTDKTEYSPGDVMQININISNPTENSTVFEWYLGIPQFGYWLPMAKGIIIAPDFNESFTTPFSIGDWGSKPFAGYWVVHLLDDESGKVQSQDASCWAYVPVQGGEGKGKTISREDIVKGIEEGIGETVFLTAESAEKISK